MAPERWQRIQDLYHAARALPDRDRTRFLAGACADDDALRHEVQALLDQPVSTAGFREFVGGPVEAAAHADSSLTGRRVGSYEVVALLGRGGMGEVYRAHDVKLGRDVAIKVLPARFTDASLPRLESEARMLAVLNHPHIGAIYGLEAAGGLPALVLELVEGETLADRLKRGPIAPRDALTIARQIADALDAAHRKGIIHRDLKPANIKVTSDGVVKVLDFGLAKAIDSGGSPRQAPSQVATAAVDATQAGMVLGTAPYMSPEQARGLPVDTRTDIWAFGCVLYELLAGRNAFPGQTFTDIVTAIFEREPDWKALPWSTPPRIRRLLRRCLQRDLALRVQNVAEARDTIDEVQRGWNRWRTATIAAAAIAALATAAALWWREPARPVDRSEWVQITQMPDSVVQPALSPDGRMVAFIRGPSESTPMVPGQVYVKILPDGEPVQLTNDTLAKMSPVFSPDGSRIAYTTVNRRFEWDTWTVPVLGGQPQRWLQNASGLIWTRPGTVLFSEMKKNPHMGIVSASESRIDQRDVYLPAGFGMAHRSYPSPDGQSVLVVEMDRNLLWMPCRLLPADGSSPGRQVGPPEAGCTYAAWSPDGKWMYFTSNAGGTNHIWRQRFPDGQPEQMTSGPTEEEGLALAPDGRSLVTAVSLENVSVWVHDARGDRQIALEGNTVNARFSSDGTRLFYKVVERASSSWDHTDVPGELRVTDLQSGRTQAVMPGFQALDYDVAPDREQVVVQVRAQSGESQIWLAAFDGLTPPRKIPTIEGAEPTFGPDGDIFFRHTEAGNGYVYRVRPDGTGLRKVLDQPIVGLGDVLRDGRYVTAFAVHAGSGGPAWWALSLDGGPSGQIGMPSMWHWSATRDWLSISGTPIRAGRSYMVPLRPGELLPEALLAGVKSEEQVAAVPGARRVDVDFAVPGPSPDVYAYSRTTTQRNLYRIPIR